MYTAIIGGSNGSAIAIDSEGNAYITGVAREGFPTARPFQAGLNSETDAFVANLNSSGSALLFSTFLGGNRKDWGVGIAVDSSKDVYVMGGTLSSDFPTTAEAFQSKASGFGEANQNYFVTKLAPTGNGLLYSTYLPSHAIPPIELGGGIAIDGEGNAWVAGSTSSPEFPMVNPFQSFFGGSSQLIIDGNLNLQPYDAFVAELNAFGSQLLFSTYLGGSEADHARGITLGPAGDIYVAGSTLSSDFPCFNAYQATYRGESAPVPQTGDAFLAKISRESLVSATSAVFNTAGGAGEIHISAPTGHSWTATTGDSWITIMSGGTGSGEGTVRYQVEPASTSSGSRSGKILLAGAVLQVVQDTNDIFIPALVSVAGLNNSFFTSELTLTNRGNQPASLSLSYTGSSQFGGGSGSATTSLDAGRQIIIPDAMAYLQSLGIPIPPSGSQLGTLRIRVSGIAASELGATVRTTTAVENGRAGLAYSGILTSNALTQRVYICGLQHNSQDRSNLALQNIGMPSEGDIILQVTVFSGDLQSRSQVVLPRITLAPGDFRQINGILQSEGLMLSNGYALVERVAGSAPFYAYGVINDQSNSDGSFVSPQEESDLTTFLPAVVETPLYQSELTLTNWSQDSRTINLFYRADGIETDSHLAATNVILESGQQMIIPNFVDYLRQNGITGVQKRGITYAGPLQVDPTVPAGQSSMSLPQGVFAGVRTFASGGGGRYGVFYRGTDISKLAEQSIWVYGLQQNDSTRSNLAVTSGNAGTGDTPGILVKIDIFDGDTGAKVTTLDRIFLNTLGWLQFNGILANYAPGVKQGYARVTPVLGSVPILAYGVLNDGAVPGDRTGDGAIIVGSP